MFTIVGRQMIFMGTFMFLGAILFKTGLVSKEGSKSLVNLLIYIVAPAAIFKSMCIERTTENIKAFGLSFVLCAFIQIIELIVAHICFKKSPIEDFASTYASGFFGLPLIEGVLGPKAVFFMAPMVVFVGTLQHTYGVRLLVGKQNKFDFKRLILAPNAVCFVLGSIVFFTNIGPKFPPVINKCISLTSDMNAFFTMTILGTYIAQADLRQLYKNIKIYLVAFIRLIALPLLCLLIFKFIPVDYNIKMSILLASAAPVGPNVANYSLLFNKDYGTASLHVVVSTILCLITLPLFGALVEKLL